MTLKKKFALATALVVLGTLASLMLLTPKAVPEEPLPNPNGYEDFMKGAALASKNSGDVRSMPIEELRALGLTNHAALELIRTGLSKSCRVIPYELTNSTRLENLAAQKRVAQAFVAASRLALMESRTNDAAKLALECVRFGSESACGGVLIDALVGVAIRNIGLASLNATLPGADTNAVREIVATLDEIASRQETCADVFNREKQWIRMGRFGSVGFITRLVQPFMTDKYVKSAEQKFAKGLNTLHHTKLRAAAHAYELEHAKPPAAAADLVPQYLKAIPLDATTGKELPLD